MGVSGRARVRVVAPVATILIALAACGSDQPSTTPRPSITAEPARSPAGATPSDLSSVSPSQPTPSLDGRPFPIVTGEGLAPGRYISSPPFDIAFTFEVPTTGWESMHLHADFFDIGRFVTDVRPAAPERWIAWGHPAVFYGATEVPSSGLTPDEAIGLFTARDDLTAAGRATFTFAGRAGVRIDLHASAQDTPLFGGPGGAFGLEPSLDARLGVIALEEDLLVVMVLARTDELDAAWLEAQRILDSVELPGV